MGESFPFLFQGACYTQGVWGCLRADEVVLQLHGSNHPQPYPVDGLQLLLVIHPPQLPWPARGSSLQGTELHLLRELLN